jgi:hypothetical protein
MPDTNFILFLDFAVVNEDMKMTPPEWIDLLHTIVPVAYFDFVLLDKREIGGRP